MIPAESLFPPTPGQLLFLPGDVTTGRQPLVQIIGFETKVSRLPGLREAWKQLLHRHEALRTGFAPGPDAGLAQFVANVATPNFRELNWRDRADPDGSRWAALLEEEGRVTFDLACPPLWRLVIVVRSDSDVRWILNFHHAVLDGRSVHVLMGELLRLRRGDELGGDAPMPARVLSACLNQRRELEARSVAGTEYWSQLYKDDPETDLPRDFAPISQSSSGGAVAGRAVALLDPVSHVAFHAWVRAERIAAGTAILGACGLVLCALTDRPQVVFGTVRPCRRAKGASITNAVGLCLNTIPFSVAATAETPVRSWLKEIGTQQMALREVELDTASDIRSRAGGVTGPLFTATVVIEQERRAHAMNRLVEPGDYCRFSGVNRPAGAALIFAVHLTPQLKITVSHQAGLFDEGEAQQIAETALQVLKNLMRGAAGLLGDIGLTDQAAEQVLTEIGQGINAPLDSQDRLHTLVERTVDLHPKRVAVVDERGAFTYGELDAASDRLAARLIRHGVGTNRFCALALPRGRTLLIAMLGVLKSGGAMLLLDESFPPARLARLLDSGAPFLTLAQVALAAALETEGVAGAIFDPEKETSDADSVSSSSPEIDSRQDDLAYGIFTSGSTGEPKLVAIEHRQVVNLLRHATNHLVSAEDAACMPWVGSPAFDSCISQIFVALIHGGTLVALSGLGDLANSPFFSRFTAMGASPSQLGSLEASGRLPPALRLLSLGAESVPASLLEKLERHPRLRRVLNLYGPTETTVYATAHILMDRDPYALAAEVAESRGVAPTGSTIGRPITNTLVRIVSPWGALTPRGWPGELWINGLGVGRGYIAGSQSVQSLAFSPDHRRPNERLYRTGDRVRWTIDEQLCFLGRRDHQVKIRGVRIEPQEIVAHLIRFDGVNEAHVEVRHRDEGGAVLVAWIVASPGLDLSALRVFAAGQLPAPAVPALWQRLSALPLTHSGKVDSGRLEVPIAAPSAQSATTTETRLFEIWRSHLPLAIPGPDDNFFAVGGDSLLATVWLTAIEKYFGVKLAAGFFAQNPTLRALARGIDQITPGSDAKQRATLMPLNGDAPGTPLIIFPGGEGDDVFIREYQDFARHLAGRRPVEWFVRPGFETFAEGESILSAVVAEAAGLIGEKYSGRRVVLLGHCLGAGIAWRVALALEARGFSDLALVLCEPWLPEERPRLRELKPGRWLGRFYAYRSVWRHWVGSNPAPYRHFGRLVQREWKRRRVAPVIPDPRSKAFRYELGVQALKPSPNCSIVLLRNTHNRQAQDAAAWANRGVGAVQTHRFKAGYSHSLARIAHQIIPLLPE